MAEIIRTGPVVGSSTYVNGNKVERDYGFTLPNVEHRWVYLKINANGSTTNVGCKAYLHCLPKGIPEVEIAPGEITETEPTYTVTRYRLVHDGKELFVIDRLANKISINGKDYAVDIEAML